MRVFNKDCNVGPGWLPLRELQVLHELGRVGSQGVSKVELGEFTRLMQNQIWPWGGDEHRKYGICLLFRMGAQQKDNSGHPSSLCPEATQLSFSLYESGTPTPSTCPFKGAQVECL